MNKLVNLWSTAPDNYMNSIEFAFFLIGLIDSDGWSTKGERVKKLLETAVLLDTLVPDTKGRKNRLAVQNKIWTKKQKSDLKRLIKETWDLNPSGPNRKFSDPDSYYLDVLNRKQRGTLSIR